MKKKYYFFTVFSLFTLPLKSASFPPATQYLSPKLGPIHLPLITPVDDDLDILLFNQAYDHKIMPNKFQGISAIYFGANVYMFGRIGNAQESDAAIFKFNEAPFTAKPKLNISFGEGGILNLGQTIRLENKAISCIHLIFNETLNCLIATILTANNETINVRLNHITGAKID